MSGCRTPWCRMGCPGRMGVCFGGVIASRMRLGARVGAALVRTTCRALSSLFLGLRYSVNSTSSESPRVRPSCTSLKWKKTRPLPLRPLPPSCCSPPSSSPPSSASKPGSSALGVAGAGVASLSSALASGLASPASSAFAGSGAAPSFVGVPSPPSSAAAAFSSVAPSEASAASFSPPASSAACSTPGALVASELLDTGVRPGGAGTLDSPPSSSPSWCVWGRLIARGLYSMKPKEVRRAATRPA
mmetsp:Transcript_35534/g.89204  ORF Transcript_35534/g.89204 Transcript_35534/m.89204 type:complete len:245 (+) Transcript_35534:380-1114(+)